MTAMRRLSHMPKLSRLLLLAVLFQAFLATGALAAINPAYDSRSIQICSVSGLKWIQVPGVNPQSDASNPHQGHCALCSSLSADLPIIHMVDLQTQLKVQQPVRPNAAVLINAAPSTLPPARAPPLFS